MQPTQDNKQNQRAILWIAALVVILTFFLLDASALAWSASLINGRQVLAEVFTFFIVVSGAAITVWKMKVN
jgi:hypothetical protein